MKKEEANFFKEAISAVPLQFKILWLLGVFLSIGFLGVLIYLAVLLIRHLS